jgi:hypothetical protein
MDGKTDTKSYMTSNGSHFMVSQILHQACLKEVGVTKTRPGDHGTSNLISNP